MPAASRALLHLFSLTCPNGVPCADDDLPPACAVQTPQRQQLPPSCSQCCSSWPATPPARPRWRSSPLLHPTDRCWPSECACCRRCCRCASSGRRWRFTCGSSRHSRSRRSRPGWGPLGLMPAQLATRMTPASMTVLPPAGRQARASRGHHCGRWSNGVARGAQLQQQRPPPAVASCPAQRRGSSSPCHSGNHGSRSRRTQYHRQSSTGIGSSRRRMQRHPLPQYRHVGSLVWAHSRLCQPWPRSGTWPGRGWLRAGQGAPAPLHLPRCRQPCRGWSLAAVGAAVAAVPAHAARRQPAPVEAGPGLLLPRRNSDGGCRRTCGRAQANRDLQSSLALRLGHLACSLDRQPSPC
jgi:hypothetical protein